MENAKNYIFCQKTDEMFSIIRSNCESTSNIFSEHDPFCCILNLTLLDSSNVSDDSKQISIYTQVQY